MRILLLVLALLLGTASRAATFTVTSRADTAGSSCAAVCTLRQAITAANATAAADTINFAIATPRTGELLIQPGSPLPTITQPLTINGYSQAGTRVNDHPTASNAILRIRVDGAAAGATPGFMVCAANTHLRGLAVTGFNQFGISYQPGCSVTGSTVTGSFVGLASSGAAAFGNAVGIALNTASATVGGAALSDRNVIAGNAGNGIFAGGSSAAHRVVNNLIGTDKTGTLDFGQSTGVQISSGSGTYVIGQAGAPNRIRFNGIGIRHTGTAVAAPFFENHISDNDQLGIDLGGNGVTANDVDDGDSGPNGLQNFPVITAAERVAGGLSLSGTLDVGPSQGGTYRIALYASSSCDPSGFGEGERLLGSFSRAISNASQSFTTNPFITSDPLPPGTFITATATSPGLETSEFSQCFSLDPVPWVVNSANDVADGACNAAHCSLRDAIIAANAASDPRPQLIHFNVGTPATGEIMIALGSSLPTITRTLAIDGYTQPGTAANVDPVTSNAQLRIRVHGSPRPLTICADGVVVRGLAVTGATSDGISVGVDAGNANCLPGDGTAIIGNFIGLASDGLTASSNSVGIRVVGARVTIGGETPADRNVISGNSGRGISMINGGIDGSLIAGNLIGTDAAGLLDRGNGDAIALGVTFGVQSVLVGSVDSPNRIQFNGRGIVTQADTDDTHEFVGNRISGNDELGIDLNRDGITANDPDDADSGANGLQNFPVLQRAERSAGGLRISGSLDVKAGTSNAPYRIDVYASASCDASGNGEGEFHIGAATVNLTQTSGEIFAFELTTDADLVATDRITATATSGEGTSEFSACLTAVDPPPGIVVNTDADPQTPATVGCDFAECTLREAIALANLQQGDDLISFNIPENLAPFDFLVGAPLPAILDGVTIDGYTQPGAFANASVSSFDAVIKVHLRGANGQQSLLRVCTPGLVTIRGLAFSNAAGPALVSGVNDGGNCNTAGFLVVQGNQFGMAPSGARFSNLAGINADKTLSIIGGSNPADRNLISNSTTYGVRIATSSSNGSQVLGNVFGRNPADTIDDANGRDIEVFGTSDVIIGSISDPAAANRFHGSSRAVVVLGVDSRRVVAIGNSHVGHTGATAIDLSNDIVADGITPKDLDDVDSGANNLQNSPVLTGAGAGAGTITVNGTLDVPSGISAAVDYRLAFYESSTCNDQSGIGNGREGEVYLGSVLRAFSSSAESFSVELPLAPADGPTFITALALSPDGNMSEFSNCLATPRPQAVFADGFE